ncbi:MAG: cytochrome c oxidase subunit 3 [Verrucomicrobiota bacterium]|nr:cytochrome c oxidase subunit 3 [Verrucomicrobiota bacterium]
MEIPYTVKPRPDTGLYNAKLGIWLFLASEVMLFGALFSSYVLLRVGAEPGTWSMGLMDLFVGAGNTMVLIASSMFVVLAWAELKQGNLAGYKKWKWATIACAVLFLCVKWGYEWPSKFKHYDVWLNNATVLHEKFDKGYHDVALHGEHADDEHEHGDAAHGGDVEEYVEKIYTTRFFKEQSEASHAAFDDAWRNGTLALSGHINAYEEAQIDVRITGWKADAGVSEADADKALAKQGAEDAAGLRLNGGLLWEKTDYDTAKRAEYALGQAGFTVALSVADYKTVKAHPWMWRTKRVTEDIGGKPRVRSIVFGLDRLDHSHHQEITLDVGDIKRLSAYEPKHSTFFGIYYTITGLHAAHVFGGILIMLYNMLPIGLGLWHRDREQFTNRIETFGLFWHFVDLVWIFLFPILYIL